MPEVRFHHISLTCPDSIAVEQFYRHHFGFVRARVIALGEGQIVFIRNRKMYLELFQATAAAPIGPVDGDGYPWPSVRNFSFIVDNVEAKLAAMGADANVVFDRGFTDQTDPPPPLPRA